MILGAKRMENTLKKAGSLRVLNEPLIIFFPVKLSPRRHGYNWPVERLRANKISSPLLHLAISGWGWGLSPPSAELGKVGKWHSASCFYLLLL